MLVCEKASTLLVQCLQQMFHPNIQQQSIQTHTEYKATITVSWFHDTLSREQVTSIEQKWNDVCLVENISFGKIMKTKRRTKQQQYDFMFSIEEDAIKFHQMQEENKETMQHHRRTSSSSSEESKISDIEIFQSWKPGQHSSYIDTQVDELMNHIFLPSMPAEYQHHINKKQLHTKLHLWMTMMHNQSYTTGFMAKTQLSSVYQQRKSL